MECYDDLGYLLNKTSRLAKCRVNQKLSDLGLTFPQFIVIKHLFSNKGSSPAFIAEALGYDRPTVTGILDRLVKQGLVIREANPSDLRSQTITLTGKAYGLMQEIDQCFRQVNDMILTGFLNTETDTLKGYLFRIMENLGESVQK